LAKVETDVNKIIKDYAKALSTDIDVDKIILYGPYASGTPDEWSDIELYVVSKGFAGMKHIARLNFLADKSVGVSPLIIARGGYTPEEYEHPETTLNLGWAKKHGKIVYPPQSDSE
jgi:predicted nucleotidyltransferase